MSTATLTSLALLKVNIDHDRDYLDYLRPFVLQVLADQDIEKITDQAVTHRIRQKFGLEIPQRTVQIVLRRLARELRIRKIEGIYRYERNVPLPDSGLGAKIQDAERHIQAVVHDLISFSEPFSTSVRTPSRAIMCICTFLAKFDITCLRAYLRGSVIPDLQDGQDTDIVLVSKFVTHLQQKNPERFDSFMRVVQGHMLANALLCPDLQHASRTYNGVTFFLDTPLLVQSLGVEGSEKQESIRELIRLLRSLGGEVSTFSHSRNELDSVLRGAALKINSADGRGNIVAEARRRGTTKSDLLLLANRIDEELARNDIHVTRTPPYIESFQIDESAFGQALDDEVSYFNDRARDFDINSVRSIFVLRRGKVSPSVERSRAILVTSNSSFARAAWQYGREHESSRDVSSVITDFSLANVAWLKAPMGAPLLPRVETLAFSYAALQPSSELLGKFLSEVKKLELAGRISPRDHQILRSDIRVYDELMELTLGDEAALTEEGISETLQRVTAEIRTEEVEKLDAEEAAHRRTRTELDKVNIENQRVIRALFWKCDKRSGVIAGTTAVIFFVVLVVGVVAGIGVRVDDPILGWGLVAASTVVGIFSLANLLFGMTAQQLHKRIQIWFRTWLLRREAKSLGLDLSVWEET